MKENSDLAELLRQRKLKATSTRLEVLSIISSYNKAIPFFEIQNALHGIDRVTLYRTINALMENGIIHKALIDEKGTFFAMCSNSCSSNYHNHKHMHFKCSSCQTVTCIQPDKPISFSIKGYLIENYKIETTGVCVSCNY